MPERSDPTRPDDDANPPADRGLRWRRWAFWLTIPVVLALDLTSKAWLFAYLEVPEGVGPGGPDGRPVWLLEDFLRLSAHVNAGAAFGMGGKYPLLIFGLTLFLLPMLVWMAMRTRESGAPLWALGAVLGGALGNLYDRIWETGVRDFFEFVKPWSSPDPLWPVFNVADMGIVGGVAIFFVWTLLQPTPQTADKIHNS